MPRLATLVVLLFAALFVAKPGAARDNSARHLNRRRHEAAKRWELSARAPNTAPEGVKNITFSNPKASRA
jgi:hypothetical protein